MKKILVLVFLTTIATNTSAFRIIFGNNIIISQPVYDDLYITGGTIIINATIYGDLICAGGTIIINDTVTNDILVVGSKVIFNGFVGDDVRCAGGELIVQKSITGDLVITGGKIKVNRDVIIGNGLLVSGGEITLNGIVKNSIKIAIGNLVFNGVAEKDIDMRGGRLEMNGTVNGSSVIAAAEIIIGNTANFNNNIRYWNKNSSLDFRNSIKSGNAVYDTTLKMQDGRWYYLGALLWYISMALLMIAIIQYLFSNIMKKAGHTVLNATLKSMGFGLLFFIAVPIMTFIAFITVVGLPIGLFLLFNFIILALLASIISSVVISNWIDNRFNYMWTYWKLVFAALGILIGLQIVSFIPILGWVVMLLVLCVSFGAILLNIRCSNPIVT